MSDSPPPVHHEKALFAELGFSTELSSVQQMRPVTRYAWRWLVVTAVLALIGIWASPYLPYWGSIVLGLVVAVVTFPPGRWSARRRLLRDAGRAKQARQAGKDVQRMYGLRVSNLQLAPDQGFEP
jgi:hypothetical protein